MYGLMKAQICTRHGDEANLHRLHYCGTCKTMGALYGQKSRFFLNNDAVFLSELLTALSPELPSVQNWEGAYQSFNCFALPSAKEEMPLPLQIAARATLVMIEFKLTDQQDDSGQGRWKFVQKVYSSNFYEATQWLKEHGFPIKTLWEWYQAQAGREAEARTGLRDGNPTTQIDFVAEPTATVTGLMFQHSIATLGGSDTLQKAMFDLGYAFGSLVYTLDSFEDYEKDIKSGEFNAIKEAYRLSSSEVPEKIYTEIIALLRERQAEVERALRVLPLPEGMGEKFIARLRTNMNRRLGTEEPSSCTVRVPAQKRSFRENWKSAVDLAHRITTQHIAEKPTLSRRLGSPFTFLNIMGIALLLPVAAQRAKSLRECRDLPLNLIVVGSAVGSLGTRFGVPAFAGGSPTAKQMRVGKTTSSSEDPQVTVVRRRRRMDQGGCCESCACGCCESCACECCTDIACCEAMQCGECCAGASCCASS